MGGDKDTAEFVGIACVAGEHVGQTELIDIYAVPVILARIVVQIVVVAVSVQQYTIMIVGAACVLLDDVRRGIAQYYSGAPAANRDAAHCDIGAVRQYYLSRCLGDGAAIHIIHVSEGLTAYRVRLKYGVGVPVLDIVPF